jgi:hypothetical protein
MARNPNFTLSHTILDYSAEAGTTSINVADAIDVASAPVATFRTDFLAFFSAGIVQSASATTSQRLANSAIGSGNREDKYLVRYQDNTTLKIYNFQVPSRDNSLTQIAGTDRVDPAQVGYSDAKSAFEAIAVSPDGNPVTLIDVLVI